MENSSVPFRAFLGAILSVVKGEAVEVSVFNRDMELNMIEEEEESPLTPDADNGSGEYKGRPGKEPIGSGPATHSGGRTAASSKKAALMIRTFLYTLLSQRAI